MIDARRLLAAGLIIATLASLRGSERGSLRLTDPRPTQGAADRQRCEVSGDSRESMLLGAGEQIEVPVRVPTAALLRFSVATDAPLLPAPAWRLTVEDARTAGVVLVEDSTAPSHRWVDRSLDLGRWSGRWVTIRVTAGTSSDGPSARLCWSNAWLTTRPRRGRLVVVILLDTVRADHLSLYGYRRATSPALEALARDSVTFDDAGSDASWTRASVATLLTGQSALVHDVLTRHAHLDLRWPTMAERFRAAGAQTVALSTNPNILPFWGFARGFDRFVDVGAAEWTHNSDASRVLGVAREVIAAAGAESTLLYVHINDAHSPYEPPPAVAAALLGTYDSAGPGRIVDALATATEISGAIDRYDAELAYLDSQLGQFFTYLKERGRYHSSLIVVIGDHGEEFMDHGGVYHGHTLFREQVHVPLIVKLPGLTGAGSRVQEPATMVDVMPTMLALLDMPIDGLPGRLLVNATGRHEPTNSLPRFAFTDVDDATVYAAEDATSTLIIQTRPRFRRWLFDRKSDPHQRHDLSAASAADVERLQRLLDDRLLSLRGGWHARLCGGPDTRNTTLHIQSATSLERLEAIELEAADRLNPSPDGTGLTLSANLAPQLRHEELFGKLATRKRPDRDEVVFATAGPVTVAVADPTIVPRIGADGRSLESDTPTVSMAEARAPAVYVPVCAGDPALFVWYAGVDSTVQRAIDPAIAERLRALGYGE